MTQDSAHRTRRKTPNVDTKNKRIINKSYERMGA